jgi:hypothetical protein
MKKILNITDRLEDRKRSEQIETYRNKFESVQRLLQCSGCHFKCSMCGHHVERAQEKDRPPATELNFNLCSNCLSEFEDFLKASNKEIQKKDIFWHTEEWLELWSTWVTFQRALNNFKASINLKQLNHRSCD